jgi:ubiquitin-protein ligase
VTGSERRLHAEWELLQKLAQLNPDRLAGISADDRVFRVTLREAPTRMTGGGIVSTHRLRVVYPSHFPAAPLEIYVDDAFCHPNVHPETGFVCVWDRHRIDNTVEHAVHKVVAMMGGRLCNRDALHVMQPEALRQIGQENQEAPATPNVNPLWGIDHDTFALEPPTTDQELRRRRRLS